MAPETRSLDTRGFGLAVGALWAFVDGFAGGYAFAWLYDRRQRPVSPRGAGPAGEAALPGEVVPAAG